MFVKYKNKSVINLMNIQVITKYCRHLPKYDEYIYSIRFVENLSKFNEEMNNHDNCDERYSYNSFEWDFYSKDSVGLEPHKAERDYVYNLIMKQLENSQKLLDIPSDRIIEI